MSRDNDPTTLGKLLGDALDARARGDVSAARSKSRTFLACLPADASGWRVLSYASLDLGSALALALQQRGVACVPDSPDAWTDIASLAQSAGRSRLMLRALRCAAALDPSGSTRWRNLGMTLNASALDGLPVLRRALCLSREDAVAHRVVAEAHFARGEDGPATSSALRALICHPSDAEALLVRGLVAQRRQDLPIARSTFGRAAAVVPTLAAAWHNLAVVASAEGDPISAARFSRRALVVEPAFVHALLHSGNRRIELADVAGAIRRFRRVLASTPGFPEAEANLGMVSLLDGDYVAGWRGFSARWRCTSHAGFVRTPGTRSWTGETDGSGRLLLRAEPEQALGDTLQFARFLPRAADRVGEVVVECAPTLHGLFGRMPGVSRVLATGADAGAVDWTCGLMDLGRIFAPTLESLAGSGAYLATDPAAVETWDRRLARIVRPRIGLCWRGNPRFRMDRLRSPGLSAMAPLVERARGHLVSLVLDRRSDEALPAHVADPMPSIVDMADTAALISALDLVITSDTAVAHLAGSLGRPAWILLHEPPDWRWLRNRTSSPWYPSVRLFRQPRPGDWPSAVAAVLEMLDATLPRLSPGPSAHR